MATWILLAIVAQFINAASILVDKYVLVSDRGLGKPAVYAFYVSILSGVVLVLVPFGVIEWPTWHVLGLSLIGSVTYILAILLLYGALKVEKASDALPVVGASSAIIAALLASQFLAQDLPSAFLPAFLFLVVGTFLIAHFRFSFASLTQVVLSGIFFGASAVCVKLIFLDTSFIDGFFWSRMTNVAGALLLLAIPANRTAILRGYNRTSQGLKWLVVGNKTIGGIAFALTVLAIYLGSVSVVNAMSGLQFVFLLAFAYLSAKRFPAVFKNEIHPHKFHHKLYGTICIVLGLAALFLMQ